MSKSKGNAVTPTDLLREHGTDAVRYWATSARLGVDTAIDLAQIKVGRRLAIKILNAGRFVLSFGQAAGASQALDSQAAASQPDPGQITERLDQAFVRRLAEVAEQCTAALDAYDHAAALEHAERFFWFFCDDYLELVKSRAYGEHGEAAASSALATLRLGLSVLLRLLAPFLPFVTEEVWSWRQDGSIHRAKWPAPAELRAQAGPGDDAVIAAAAAAIAAIRKAKSQARLPMKNPIPLLIATAGSDGLEALAAASRDVRSAGHVGEIELRRMDGADLVLNVVV